MYQRILVPLDKSKEAEKVLPMVPEYLTPGGEVILLHVVAPNRTISVRQIVPLESREEPTERDRAIWYLRSLISRIGAGSDSWFCEVAAARSVAEGIASYAAEARADLILMCDPHRQGLAEAVGERIGEKVWYRAAIKVQTINPYGLIAGTSS